MYGYMSYFLCLIFILLTFTIILVILPSKVALFLVVCVLRSLVLTVLMHSTSTKGKNALEYTILRVFCRTDARRGGRGGEGACAGN